MYLCLLHIALAAIVYIMRAGTYTTEPSVYIRFKALQFTALVKGGAIQTIESIH